MGQHGLQLHFTQEFRGPRSISTAPRARITLAPLLSSTPGRPPLPFSSQSSAQQRSLLSCALLTRKVCRQEALQLLSITASSEVCQQSLFLCARHIKATSANRKLAARVATLLYRNEHPLHSTHAFNITHSADRIIDHQDSPIALYRQQLHPGHCTSTGLFSLPPASG